MYEIENLARVYNKPDTSTNTRNENERVDLTPSNNSSAHTYISELSIHNSSETTPKHLFKPFRIPDPPVVGRVSMVRLIEQLSQLVLVNDDVGLLLGRLNRVPGLENRRQFLERALAGLDEEEIDHQTLERVPEDEEEVVFPACACEGDLGDEGVVEACDVDEKLDSFNPLAWRGQRRGEVTGFKLTLYIPIPFALDSYRRHSTGYIAWFGVQPME